MERHAWDDDRSEVVGEGESAHGESGAAASSMASADEGLSEGGESSGSDFQIQEVSAEEEFVQECILLFLQRVLNARQFCTLMFRAGRAGNAQAVRYGLNPDAPSGHFQRHLNSVMQDLNNLRQFLYTLRVPGSSRKASGRVVHDLSVMIPYEQIDADLQKDQGAFPRLADAIDEGALPPSYFSHALVRGAPPATVFPVNLFIDGVRYSLTDTVIGFWFVDVLSGKRYLFATLRKRLVCECGCKIWRLNM